MRHGWTMEMALDVRPEALAVARKLVAAVATAAGARERAAFDLQVALGEALANAFLHAYGGRPGGRVRIGLEFDETGLVVTVRDTGSRLPCFPKVPDSVPLTDEHGRGLFIMSALMDDVQVIHPYRRGRGTAVRMTKRLRVR